EEVHAAFRDVIQLCHKHGAKCLVNSCHPETWWTQADGVHLRAADANALAQAAVSAPRGKPVADLHVAARDKLRFPGLLAVSVHDSSELAAARALAADFVVLGHVLDTASHPGQPGMGWEHFAALADQAGLPVMAIGGQSRATLGTAQSHGAHGIASITGLF